MATANLCTDQEGDSTIDVKITVGESSDYLDIRPHMQRIVLRTSAISIEPLFLVEGVVKESFVDSPKIAELLQLQRRALIIVSHHFRLAQRVHVE